MKASLRSEWRKISTRVIELLKRRGDKEAKSPVKGAEESSTVLPLPQSYWMGQELDWEAPSERAVLWVELPFWLMVDDSTLKMVFNGHEFQVDVRSNFVEVHAGAVLDSRESAVYIGSNPDNLDPALKKQIEEEAIPVLGRPCKTVLRIHSRCNRDVIVASLEANRRTVSAKYYLAALCEAHLELVNQVIRSYRLATYDYFPYEVSPWDVPVWLVGTMEGHVHVGLLLYAGWDHKPTIGPPGGPHDTYSLIEPDGLQAALERAAGPGELELLDAHNLMERGDYTGAVRRITTAIEAVLEAVLRRQLVAVHGEAEADIRLEQSRNDFPGRLRQYERLSGRQLPDVLRGDLETTRQMRHQIVHKAMRITFSDRGKAYRAVDTGRWTYNWFEDDPERKKLRDSKLAKRSIGRHHSIFNAHIEPEGVVVDKPHEDDDFADAQSEATSST